MSDDGFLSGEAPVVAPRSSQRYVTLDGMRGIAALAVALFHFDFIRAPHGYIAVDFFFALSGFVLWQAYHERWKQKGYGILPFMRQRAIRLYPLFLLGILLCTATTLGQMAGGDWNARTAHKIAYSLPTNLLMLPSPVTQALFPINLPAWTLFFELVASFFMVTVLFRLPWMGLVAVCLLSAWALVPVVIERQSANIGALWREWPVALARTAFSFALGAIVARLPQPAVRPRGWVGALCLLAIAYVLGLFVGFGMGVSIPVKTPAIGHYDLTCILLLWPVLLVLGSRFEVPSLLATPSKFLGDVSFALYAVHWALIDPFKWLKDDVGVPALLSAVLYIGTALTVSWCAVKWFDEPVRRKLSAIFRGGTRSPLTASAT
ncbi:acyltransferase family protein [Novosphingobium album (ex Hu et al. 2023)]|uniref:Acyltransferase n=1 Tax=Novosphingobium album (ex Hu et al. 2023) TaxID=2930093 RepID=A0ABT0AX59_9SPHN|nr:acyltransferase [Novosphingobium album (ex Hu et al. 2023)]MCJ2177394.1 acyltransferase [Novosphingobium album (ex Hu et al. 2023)]